MNAEISGLNPGRIRIAWEELCTSGTASADVARILQVGVAPYLDAFTNHFLGADGVGRGFKLVLGMNGEGKTHLLYCLRERALQAGHAVALIEAKASSAGESPFEFARAVLSAIEPPDTSEEDGELRIIRLLRWAVQKKRSAAEKDGGVDPDAIVAHWAKKLATKELHPLGLAQAVSDGVQALLQDDEEALLDAAKRATFDGVKLTKAEAAARGGAFLKSIPQLIRHLDARPLLLLVDEAETAVERKSAARRMEFLKFLRLLNDHVANSRDAAAMVVLSCTDDFWPEEFKKYTALHQRLSDPGLDSIEERVELSPAQRIATNKLWVRETFPGDEADYEALGAVIVDLAGVVHPGIDVSVQRSTGSLLAKVASSDRVKRQVKRTFVKALAQNIQHQMLANKQAVLPQAGAEKRMDAAAKEIAAKDDEG